MAGDGVERRQVICLGLAIPAGLVLAGCTDDGNPPPRTGGDPTATPGGAEATGPGDSLPPTPACVDERRRDARADRGPLLHARARRNAPTCASPGSAGTALVVTGTVLGVDCRPVERALLDFWQADDAGEYDNDGFRLRGHQFTDGRRAVPAQHRRAGLYPGRTRHIHVKVQAPDEPVLTTQLYFPGEPGNAATASSTRHCC